MENIIDDLNSGDDAKIERAYETLCNLKAHTDIIELLNLLEANRQMSVLTYLALAVKSLKLNEAVPLLIRLIRDPEFNKKRGVFVGALSELDCSDYIDVISELVLDDGYEVRELALRAIESNQQPVKKEIKEKSLLILKSGLHKSNDPEKDEYIDAAIQTISSFDEK